MATIITVKGNTQSYQFGLYADYSPFPIPQEALALIKCEQLRKLTIKSAANVR